MPPRVPLRKLQFTDHQRGTIMSDWKKDFDLSEPVVIVRLMAGLFYIPHILFKLMGFSASVAAFGRMGFEPALYWLLLAVLVETICVVGLTLNLYTHFVGLMSAGTMALAVYGTFASK